MLGFQKIYSFSQADSIVMDLLYYLTNRKGQVLCQLNYMILALCFSLRIYRAILIDLPYYITNADIVTGETPYFMYFPFTFYIYKLWYVKFYFAV